MVEVDVTFPRYYYIIRYNLGNLFTLEDVVCIRVCKDPQVENGNYILSDDDFDPVYEVSIVTSHSDQAAVPITDARVSRVTINNK